MAKVLSGPNNASYTAPSSGAGGGLVRVIINFMYATSTNQITINWAGQSVTYDNVEAIGKNIANASGFYGDYFNTGWNGASWFFPSLGEYQVRSALNANGIALKMPTNETSFKSTTSKGWFPWFRPSSSNIVGSSIAVALPLEIYLNPGETFSATCNQYNILLLREDGSTGPL